MPEDQSLAGGSASSSSSDSELEPTAAAAAAADDDDGDEGSIGIVGAFNGVSTLSPNNPGAALALNSSDTSFVVLSQQASWLLAAGSSEGQVKAACALYGPDGSLARAYFGGTISRLNSTTVGYVFGMDAAGRLDAMAGGVNGPVNALYCDNEMQRVYVGGNFSSTAAGLAGSVATMRSASTGGLAIYGPAAGAWQQLPFHGLDGPVFGFEKAKGTVYAVGAFAQTVDNSTYVALNTQPIDLTACRLTGGNSAETAGFSDPRNIVCTAATDQPGNTWLMRDKLPGYYRIDFPFSTTPSLLRLMNTAHEGRGTKVIRVEAAGTNQALTLSYMDPDTKTEVFCTQECPMRQDYSWQEFRFAGDDQALAGLTGVIINIVDWYGMGGGFNKVELYQRDSHTYAVDAYNGFPCGSQAIQPSAQVTGPWKTTSPASYRGSYLTLTVGAGDIHSAAAQSAMVAVVPYIPESGFYKVFMTIPGCQNTNTCGQRTSANVTWLMNGKQSILTAVAQHNVADREIELFTGYAPASTPAFSSVLYVGISPNGTADPQAATVEVVVDSFRLERVTSYTNLNGVLQLSEDLAADAQRDGPLFRPLKEGLPKGSVVRAVAYGVTNSTTQDGTLFLGGQFSSPGSSDGKTPGYLNIVQYRNQSIVPLARGGLRGMVRSMAFVGPSLYVGGTFNATADSETRLGNVAQYNTTDGRWFPLVGGTDGPVASVAPYSPFGERAVVFTGEFGSVFAGDLDDQTRLAANGLAMWDSLAGGWTNKPYLDGRPSVVWSQQWSDAHANLALTVGSFSGAAALEANGAVLLTAQENIQAIDRMGFDLQRSASGQFVVNTGLWYSKDSDPADAGSSTLIVGGLFQTLGSATNVARLDGGKWRRLLDDDVDGEVLTINSASNLLFIGGAANTTEDPSLKDADRFSGLIVYDMDRQRTASVQQLQGPNASRAVRVNKVAIRENTSMVVVGGNFTKAGSMMDCPFICTLDINERQWNQLSSSALVDEVTDLLFVHDGMVVAGTFKNGTQPTRYIMRYDFGPNKAAPGSTGAWVEIPGAERLPGPVTGLTPATSSSGGGAQADNKGAPRAYYIVGQPLGGGTPYLAKFDGSEIAVPSFALGAQSTIRGLLEVPQKRIPPYVLGGSASSPSPSPSSLTRRAGTLVPQGMALAVSGDLWLPDGRRASNAFYSGNNVWTPFLSTIQSGGGPGFVGSMFFEIPPTSVFKLNRLSVALVILVAVAIALGITFFIVLIGLVYVYLRNRREVAATASAASAALAAAAAGGGAAGTSKVPMGAASALGATTAGARRYLSGDQQLHSAAASAPGSQGGWGARAGPVSFDNIAPSTGRLHSGSPALLSELAAAGVGAGAARLAVPSSGTYVQSEPKKGPGAGYEESLESIFESAAAEAEAEAENEARARAASAGSMAAVAGGAAAGQAMPTPHHYDAQGNLVAEDAPTSSGAAPRPDSTNPFEQRRALRESQQSGAFPPAGPFGEGLGHIPMPSARHLQSEHVTAAALAGAAAAAAAAAAPAAAAGGAGAAGARDNRGRSESASTQGSGSEFSASQMVSSRPSGESSASGLAANLPIRDSLKQHPVFYAKFTFSSRETGELGFRAGERVFVIDQSDEIWWMGIVDHGADQPLEQGVFPATYVSSEPPKSTDWSELM